MSSKALPPSLQPVADVLKDHGLDWLRKELAEGRWVAYWHNEGTGKLHEISHVYWRVDDTAKETLLSGFADPRLCETYHDAEGYPHLVQVRHPLFVAPAEVVAQFTSRNRGGRPATHDWLSLAIFIMRYIFDNGLPKTQTELARVMEKHCFDIGVKPPADSELQKLAQRIFQEFERDSEN